MIIDFHTHTFPDQIAASAIARLSNNAHIEAHSNGTAGGCCWLSGRPVLTVQSFFRLQRSQSRFITQ